MAVRDGHLYFTNTDQNIFARIAINEDGTPYIEGLCRGDCKARRPDRLCLRNGRHVLPPARGESSSRVRGNTATTIALNVTVSESELFSPTALAWGKIDYGRKNLDRLYGGIYDGEKLLISTSGGTAQYLTGEYSVGGTISQVQIVH